MRNIGLAKLATSLIRTLPPYMKGVFALDCRFFRVQIVIDSYEELHAKAKKSLEAHLQICPECEQYRGSVHQVQQFLDQWEDIDRPIDIEALHRAILPS